MKVTAERARTYGEVLTPTWMVREMLAAVPQDVTGEVRILDLCSGRGAFLTEILRQRLAAVTPGDIQGLYGALTGLYGIELLPENIDLCRAALRSEVTAWLAIRATTQILGVVDRILAANLIRADVLGSEKIYVPRWTGGQPMATIEALTPNFFTLIVSNPPYQRSIAELGDRNQSKATPIYQHFYDFARSLNSTRMLFIMPAKWYTGGWGLDRWRASVLAEDNVVRLDDYRDSHAIFPTTEVNGGICWLLRDTTHHGPTHIRRHDRQGNLLSDTIRPLREPGADFLVRDEGALSILRKVGSFQLAPDDRFSTQILSTTPFGLASNFTDYKSVTDALHDIRLYYIKRRWYWINSQQVRANTQAIDTWKIFLPLSFDQHSRQIIGEPQLGARGEVCTHSYLCVAGFTSEAEANSAITYMRTRFFRFLAGQLKISPIATRQVYRLIPIQAWNRKWTDTELYANYGFTTAEISLIEQTISPM